MIISSVEGGTEGRKEGKGREGNREEPLLLSVNKTKTSVIV